MPDDELFNDLPVQVRSQIFDAGGPRLREPVRDQIELRAVDLDRLIGPEHAARVIWEYVQGLDLGSLEQAVRAREHTVALRIEAQQAIASSQKERARRVPAEIGQGFAGYPGYQTIALAHGRGQSQAHGLLVRQGAERL